MAKTPRARKVSDAKASGETKPAKKTAAKQAAPAKDAPATAKASRSKGSTAGRATAAKKSDAKQRASIVEKPPAAKKAAKEKTMLREQASASKKATKKASKKTAAAIEAPAPKKASKKKAVADEAPASKKKASNKKASSADEAPASKKASNKKKANSDDTPASKKASKKKADQAAASQQLAFSMDIDAPANSAASAPASRGPLQPGDRIPDFTLEGDDGQTYSRQSLAGERFVLYFYPKDDTPGCTRQACDFRDNRPRFESASVKVLGVSGDTLKSHGRFRSKYELDFPLLADPERTVAKAFGAVGEKKLYGKTSIGIIRSTFLVGPGGVVEKTFSPVKVDGHADAVLQAIGAT